MNLTSETFPGPPNYQSAAAGDQLETYFFVTLARPVCVSEGSSELEPAIERVQTIQLIFDSKTARDSHRQLWPSLNRGIACSGVLLGRHTGHHHSEVMLIDAKCHDTEEPTPEAINLRLNAARIARCPDNGWHGTHHFR